MILLIFYYAYLDKKCDVVYRSCFASCIAFVKGFLQPKNDFQKWIRFLLCIEHCKKDYLFGWIRLRLYACGRSKTGPLVSILKDMKVIKPIIWFLWILWKLIWFPNTFDQCLGIELLEILCFPLTLWRPAWLKVILLEHLRFLCTRVY